MWQLLVEVYIYPLDEVLHRSSEPLTDNGFELVQSTLVEDTEINVLINIQVQHTAGEYAVYRATPLAQIAEGGTMRKVERCGNSTKFPTLACWSPNDGSILTKCRLTLLRLIQSEAVDLSCIFEPIVGCQSYLLRPCFNRRFETPDDALVMMPDPRSCQYETRLAIIIKQYPPIRAFFVFLHGAEIKLPGVMVPAIFPEQARSEMMEALWLNIT